MHTCAILATGFTGGDWGLLLLIVMLSLVLLVCIGASAVLYNAYLTFAPPKPRSNRLIILVCVVSVLAGVALFVGSFIFAPDGNNYLLRFFALAVLVVTCTGTTKAWRARKQMPR